MNVEGRVRLLVTVAPNGIARAIEPLGGSRLLLKAAEDAVYKWKWAASSETKEVVELNFHPQQNHACSQNTAPPITYSENNSTLASQFPQVTWLEF